MPTWREIKGAYGRRRRALRQAVLKPLLVGWPTMRDTVMHALAARGQLVLCELGDVRFFVDPADRVVGAWLMWHGEWQRREIDQAVAVLAASGQLPPDAVFVDVGANIGTHTVYALKSGRFARAVAFEPEPRNARLLAMNIEANKLADAVTILAKAAGDAAGSAVLHLHPRNKGAHALGTAPSDDGREQLDVPVVRVENTLGELGLSADRLGLIWIDVEGHEPQVLRGLGALLARRVPIALEYAPRRYGEETRRELVRLLAVHYSTWHSLSAAADHRAPIAALDAVKEMDDILVF
ncbi:MAG: FkbM family methyltransferase [Xanthobacteraceae bacterium]